MSSGSSRGSLGSLSASSKSSLNLSLTDIYASQPQYSSDTNLQDLHRRVEKLLLGHSIPPIHEVTGSMENVAMSSSESSYRGQSSNDTPQYSKSLSVGSSNSLSPPVSPNVVCPPPPYEKHLGRLQQCAPLLPNVNNPTDFDHLNLQARLSELSTTQQASDTSASPNTQHMAPSGAKQLQHKLPQLPLNTAVDTRRILFNIDSSLSTDTAVSNQPWSPLSETSSGVCNNLSGGNTRSVSAAVSDESVAGDSGVFEASIKR